MKVKKLIALVLALSMLLSLSACANTQTQPESTGGSVEKSTEQTGQKEETSSVVEEEKGIVFPLEEPVTFTMMNNYFNDEKLADNPIMELLSEMTNVSFEHIEVLRADSVEKANLLVNGDEYPDCFFKVPDLDFASLGEDGIVIPLEDLIREYAPNLTALLDEMDGWDDFSAADGHIYVLSSIGVPSTAVSSSVLWYNKAWMEKVGITEEPANMDELYTMLKAFKENDVNGNGDPDDEIPLHLNMNQTWKNMQAYMIDGLHWHKTGMALMDEGEHAGKMVFYPRTEEFKENLLKYLIQWYQEGLIDQNMFTQTYEQSTSIGQTSNIYGMFWNTLAYQAAPEANITEYYSLTPFEKGYFPLTSGFSKAGFAITDKCENPEILIAWVDQLYSDEGGNLASMGREGIDYVVNADGSYTATEGYRRIHGGCQTPCKFTSFYNNKDRGEATYQNYELGGKMDEYGVSLPTINNNQEETQRINDLTSNIQAYMENYVAELIVGELSLEDTWEDFQTTLIEMGVEELESLYQAGYDRANPK